MPVQEVRLADLVEDWDIYPRHNFDVSWVRRMVDALETGSKLPPPVVARRGMRIVDGWHRVKAYRKFLGVGASIQADVRSYKSEADIVKDAVAFNSDHGRKLDAQDTARSALLLERHGVVISDISVILRMPEEKIRRITIDPSQVVVTRVADRVEKIPAKPAARSPGAATPRELTSEQEAAHRSASGWGETQMARDLIRRIESGLFVPESNPAAVTALWQLHDLIEAKLTR